MNSTSNGLQEQLEFATYACLEVEKSILKYYQDPKLPYERKKDGSLVSTADKVAEMHYRRLIEAAYPKDHIIGEEAGIKKGSTEFTWVIDPIDGTLSFLRGVPLFGSMLGLLYHGHPVLGVVQMPALNERYYALQGGGAWWIPSNRKDPLPCKVSLESYINKALFCSNSLNTFEKAKRLDLFLKFSKSCQDYRGWGDCYGHLLVASGRADICLSPIAKIWDVAALVPIVTEAGGKYFDFNGNMDIHSGTAISCNSRIGPEVMALLK